ncbi:TatD family hydrolase [Thiomicrospira pelophila]|uniref:TatD family hydrolase n=1 Tax=Thiomicrospira pelophila TaxID=934 RepID=UPI0009DF8A73|nr:TatD family hydrolase [Thiomicrospira pelophila]
MLIDTHAHLNLLQTSSEVYKYPVINVSTDLESCHSNLSVSVNNPNSVFMACGFHPWFVDQVSNIDLNLLFEFMKSNNIHIMGEIGLDFSSSHKANKQKQLEVLEAQLRFASQYNLSVSLHLVKAYDEMFALLKHYPVSGAIHSFPGSLEQAKRFAKLDIKIGVNGLILRDNAPRYHNLVRNLPISHLVLETDAPNISYPDGQTGDLGMLSLIASRISHLKNMDLVDVSTITTQNAIESFNLYERL